MQCLRCGYQNPPGTATCGQCGLTLTTVGPSPYRPPPPATTRTAGDAECPRPG